MDRRFKRKAPAAFRYRSVTVNPVDLLQPLAHGFCQVIAGLAELRVAAGDEGILLALQDTDLARVACFLDHSDVGAVNLAIEIGQLRAGADRLLARAARGGAIEARLFGNGF